MRKRLARLNEQLKRELSELIRTEVRDPRVGLVTITGVETARDLGSARVFVRVVGDAKELSETLEGLEAAAPFLRTLLGRMLRIRKVPELRFREDRSFEHARRIESLLAEVARAGEGVDEEDAGEPEREDVGDGRGDRADGS